MASFMLSDIVEKIRTGFKGASQEASSNHRTFRLVQLESALSCNLHCIMCPWSEIRKTLDHKGLMNEEVWKAVRAHLQKIQSIDFSGGGEPLLQPRLFEWIGEAKNAGCQTGFVTNGLLLTPSLGDRALSAGLDWICFSVDGSDKATYETIRRGSHFETVSRNIQSFCNSPHARSVKTMITFVIMTVNRHQLTDIVRLASRLGVSQVNFKHCDVIRGQCGKGWGLFESRENKTIRHLKKDLGKAIKLADSLNIRTTSFSFTPEELPVCAQDPRDSLFIGYNGRVAPCIGLAIGGPSTFLGKPVTMRAVNYGSLPDQSFEEICRSETYGFFKTRFDDRVKANEQGFLTVDLSEPSLLKLKAARKAAIDAMPQAPEGCRVCHYLYGI